MKIIVVGMHRTGTSALSGLLHSNGIVMGEDKYFYPRPGPENPKGFYEDIRFRNINDSILEDNGYFIKEFDPNIPEINHISQYAGNVFRTLINGIDSKHKFWGWKDPRTCLTLNALSQFLDPNTTRILMTNRSHCDVADSMIARGNTGSRQRYIKLAKNYEKTLFRNAILSKIPFRNVGFNLLMNDTERVAEFISKFIGYEISDLSFIDNKLANRHKNENA